MSDIVEQLFERAKTARKNSYSPYSNYTVGVAILSETGKIYAGTNVEEAAFVCTHAEQNAIGTMITEEGRHKILQVMVVAGEENDGTFAAPCGHCRQWLYEHGDNDMIIYAAGPEGIRKTFSLGELLPNAFGGSNLK